MIASFFKSFLVCSASNANGCSSDAPDVSTSCNICVEIQEQHEILLRFQFKKKKYKLQKFGTNACLVTIVKRHSLLKQVENLSYYILSLILIATEYNILSN